MGRLPEAHRTGVIGNLALEGREDEELTTLSAADFLKTESTAGSWRAEALHFAPNSVSCNQNPELKGMKH